MLVCEQALRGALAAGREKQGELATTRLWNRPFPFSPGSLYQNEVKCSAFDMKSHANKTHFHKKGCALGLILKVRVFRTRKWPIRKSRCEMLIDGDNILSNDVITLDTSFSMFVYIRVPFRFALIGGNLTVQSTGCHRGIGGETQGAINSTKIPTGPTGKSGPPQKVDPFFRNFSGWTEPIH